VGKYWLRFGVCLSRLVLVAVVAMAGSTPFVAAGPALAIIGGLPDGTTNSLVVKISTPSSNCSGTLVGRIWVLTAAHCLWNEETGQYYSDLSQGIVATGDGIAGRNSARSQVLGVVKHPSYTGFDNRFDIGLIQVSDVFGGVYAELASADEVRAAEDVFATAFASGFGRTSQNGSGSNSPLEVSQPLLSQTFCNSSWRYYEVAYSDTFICVRGSTSAAACSGDSGGPLFVIVNQKRKLAGTTSFGGVVCGSSYTVFSRVTSSLPFLQSYGVGLPAAIIIQIPQLPPLPAASIVTNAPTLPGFVSGPQSLLPKFTTSRTFQLVLENLSRSRCLIDIDGPQSLGGSNTRVFVKKNSTKPVTTRVLNEFGDATLRIKTSCAIVRRSGVFIVIDNSVIKIRVIE